MSAQEAKFLINLLKDEIKVAKEFSSHCSSPAGEARIRECQSLIQRLRQIRSARSPSELKQKGRKPFWGLF